ncbi:hypothetical protein [Edaphobacter dinghuensis]|uniref:Uncharacterized protein n=1 Tax=Edaphobacter dinghuensis TaxID=1560005 RepID=A0A917HBD3_9BACT|nr:hypothetical protein [Edaphobacter dinghuensis]GGG73828.1 hypothetical protein GCM10011585_15490 [Edaphobacter dinghuensis]
MGIKQALCNALDETVHALAILDLDTLQAIERQMTTLAQTEPVADGLDIDSILAKKRVLELVLYHSESNLNALRRLYGRNTRDLWER